jgi:hypothetical protein
MRAKSIVFISVILSLILMFRICFLSFNSIGFSIVSFHHSVSAIEKAHDSTHLDLGFKKV